MRRILRDPFAQFLVLGSVIFLFFGLTGSEERADTDRRISVDGPTQAWLYDNFSKQFQRPPTRSEMDALIQAHIRDEVKYREAIALGLDDRDSIVRRRMTQKFDFLFGDAGTRVTPTDVELELWYEEHVDEFVVPAEVSFTHRWFSPDRRGSDAKSDATSALSALIKGESTAGDPFPFGDTYETQTQNEVRRVFGSEFATALFDAAVDEWSGPIESGLGFHVVRVTRMTQSEALPLDAVSDAALGAWRREESGRVLAATLDRLRSDYVVEIDEAATEGFEYSTTGAGGIK